MKHQNHSSVGRNHSHILACPDCDLLLPKMKPPEGQKLACPRCGRVLMQCCNDSVSRSLAMALTGLMLYFPAIFMPLLTFQQLGFRESGNVLHTVGEFFERDYYLVAVAVFFSTVIFPLLRLSLLATVSFCLKTRRYPAFLGRLFRLYNHLGDWAMMEVYLLGIMITIIKMHHTMAIDFNIGFFCFGGLVLITMGSSLAVCKESFWMLIESKGNSVLSRFPMHPPYELPPYSTAAAHNLLLCSHCGKVEEALEPRSGARQHCTRCGAVLRFRKPASLSRTWALIITAAILLFPANLLPIMRVQFFGIPSHSTILDGIRAFFEGGSYAIAIIILTASILIPVFKIVGLAIVLLTIGFRRPRFLRQKTTMFRFIEFIGRWSMLDIFVIALLGFYVNFGFLSSIETAPAATYFCLVVITTMFAALTFDPRLMWDMVSPQQSQVNSL